MRVRAARFRNVVFAVLLSLSLSGFLFADAEGNVLVTVTPNGASVLVLHETDLKSVLSSICKQEKFSCQLEGMVLNSPVAPGFIQGSWQEILGQLLEGTKVNYVFLQPGSHVLGSLFLSPQSVVTANTQVYGAAASVLPSRRSVPDTESAGNHQPTARPESSVEEQPSDASSSVVPFNAQQPSAMGGFNGEEANYAPFPDADGRPMLVNVTNQPTPYLPSPNADGSLIPTPPISPAQYLPFPDANGNPIPAPPVSNMPTPYLPFPDPQGNPIPNPYAR